MIATLPVTAASSATHPSVKVTAPAIEVMVRPDACP